MITAEELRRILNYDQWTGEFTWKVSLNVKVKVGTKAGGLCRGRTRIKINGKSYMASRLAWLHVHGGWPSNEIDHENVNSADDSFVNLREATQSQNNANQRLRDKNTSGFKGVNWHKASHKWRAQIKKDGKKIHLGVFDTPPEAHAAYVKAATEMFGQFARAA